MNKQIFNRVVLLLFVVAVIIGTITAIIIVNHNQSQNDFQGLETVDYGSDDNDDEITHTCYEALRRSAIDGDYQIDWPEERVVAGDTINLEYNVDERKLEIQHYHHYQEQNNLFIWEE